MQINLDKLIRREIDKIDLNFSQKIDTINYCDNSYHDMPIQWFQNVHMTNTVRPS